MGIQGKQLESGEPWPCGHQPSLGIQALLCCGFRGQEHFSVPVPKCLGPSVAHRTEKGCSGPAACCSWSLVARELASVPHRGGSRPSRQNPRRPGTARVLWEVEEGLGRLRW